MSTIHLYTDGGIRPMPNMPKGTGLGGTGIVAVVADTRELIVEGATFYDHQVTNQQMELQAAIDGLQTLAREFELTRSQSIVIHSDSAYMINCFKEGWWYNWMVKQRGAWLNSSKKPVENSDRWRELIGLCQFPYHRVAETHGPRDPWTRLQNNDDRISIKSSFAKGLNVSFVKVKGHSGVELNERADKLATIGKNGTTLLEIPQ